METQDQETKKPTKGTWGRIGQSDENKLNFDVNIPQEVVFVENEPEEMESDKEGEVYYKFKVLSDGSEKYFTTGAWSLLIPLKEMAPLKDKKVRITKRLTKGKQGYEVTELKKVS